MSKFGFVKAQYGWQMGHLAGFPPTAPLLKTFHQGDIRENIEENMSLNLPIIGPPSLFDHPPPLLVTEQYLQEPATSQGRRQNYSTM